MKIRNQTHPMKKLCHFAIGDAIFLPERNDYFIIAGDTKIRTMPEHEGGTGLYGCRMLTFLISLSTGLHLAMPHLSTLVGSCENAHLVLSESV